MVAVWDLPGPEWVGTHSPWGSSWRGRLSSAWILSVQPPQGAQLLPRAATRGFFIFVSKWLEKRVTQGTHWLPMAICRHLSKLWSQVLSLPTGAGGRCRWAHQVYWTNRRTRGRPCSSCGRWCLRLPLCRTGAAQPSTSPCHSSSLQRSPYMSFAGYHFSILNPPEKCKCLLGLPESVIFVDLLLFVWYLARN